MNKGYLFQEIIVKNPVLMGTVGLCALVAICTSLKSAVVMSIITIVTLIIAQALSSLVFKHLPQWLRMGLYMLVGMAVVVPSMLILEKLSPSTMLAFGIYLPLLSVNPIIVRQCEREGVKISLPESLLNSVCAGVGYSIVLIIVGFLREFLGNGTIWEIEVAPFRPIASFLMPMGGFIIIAYMSAALRAYFKKIDPAYAEELAVNSRTAIKKSKNMKTAPSEQEEYDKIVYSPSAALEKDVKKPEPVQKQQKPSSPKDVSSPKPAASKKTASRKKVHSTSKAPESPRTTALPSDNNTENVSDQPKYQFITLNLQTSDKDKKPEGELNKKVPSTKRSTETVVSKAVPSDSPVSKSVAKNMHRERPEKIKEEYEKPTVKKEDIDTPKDSLAHDDKQVVNNAAESNKSEATIVYKSDELERLMSLSLDDIINGLPSDSEDGEKK